MGGVLLSDDEIVNLENPAEARAKKIGMVFQDLRLVPALTVADRAYECLLLEDCTGATDYGNYLAALAMVKMQGGVFGAVAHSSALIEVLAAEVLAAEGSV